MKQEETTQPVILIGPHEQKALGFNRVQFISERPDGLRESETHLSGDISIQMVGSVLVVRVVQNKK